MLSLDVKALLTEPPAAASVPFQIFDENSQRKSEENRIPVYVDQTSQENPALFSHQNMYV